MHLGKNNQISLKTFNNYNNINWASRRENLSLGVCKNKGANQPAQPRRVISAFVFHLLESIISRLATRKISIFYLVSVAEQAGLNLTLS